MTRLKIFVLISLGLILLSQIPFAYRRYRLSRLRAAIAQVNASRATQNSSASTEFVEYKGVVHVHSFLGGHSTGTFQEIISAARANNLQFVIMTEHVEREIDTAKMTLSGMYDGVLFINGNEVSTSNGERLLSVPGDGSLSAPSALSTHDVISNARGRGALSYVAYPDEFKSWNDSFDGIEVYNVFTNSKRINRALAFFDSIWSHRTYPDLVFANYLERPNQILKKWDEISAQRKVVAIAGNDSHANVGLSIQDSSGNVLFGIQLDPYETSFRLVRLHVLIPGLKPDEQSLERLLMEGIRSGHCFIGFDLLGDSSGFGFEASNSTSHKIQGDEISFEPRTTLKVTLPVRARVVMFKNGEVFADDSGVNLKEVIAPERGVYRVEVYLPQLGKLAGNLPWIISNSIYVR